MGILAWIVLGLIAGAIAKALMPGKDPGGIIVTIIIGIVGAFIGGFIFRAAGWGVPFGGAQEPASGRGQRGPDAGIDGASRGPAHRRRALCGSPSPAIRR